MKRGKIIFIEVPQSLGEEVNSLSQEGENRGKGFMVDPAIPLPIELESPDFPGPRDLADLSEKLSWEMILSGMIRVVAEGKNAPEELSAPTEVKPHWIEYYRGFVLTLRPEIYQDFTGAALIKAGNGDFDEALEIITALEGLFPFSPEVLLHKALILEDKAAELERKGSEIDGAGDYERALETYQKALSMEPLLPELLFSGGFFFFRRKNYAQAREYFTQYLPLAEDPEKREKAEALIREIESQGLDDGRFLEALDLIRQGREEEALFTVRDFLEEHSRVPNAWFVLGWALRKLGRWEKALEAYEKALELGAQGCDIRNEMAICLMELGMLLRARKELEAALREEPENVKIISNLGVLALKNNNLPEAAAFFRTVLALNPHDPLALGFFEKP